MKTTPIQSFIIDIDSFVFTEIDPFQRDNDNCPDVKQIRNGKFNMSYLKQNTKSILLSLHECFLSCGKLFPCCGKKQIKKNQVITPRNELISTGEDVAIRDRK